MTDPLEAMRRTHMCFVNKVRASGIEFTNEQLDLIEQTTRDLYFYQQELNALARRLGHDTTEAYAKGYSVGLLNGQKVSGRAPV